MTVETAEKARDVEATLEKVAALGESIGKTTTALDAFMSRLNPVVAIDGKLVEAHLEDPKKAEMEKAITAGLTGIKVWEVPVGAIAVGTFGGVFVSEILEGFTAKQSVMVKGLVKMAAGGAVLAYGKKWLGRDAAYAIAFVLGVFGLSQVLPVDKWAMTAAGTIKGLLPGTIKVTGMPGGGVVRQAEAHAADYYDRAFGR